MRATRIARAAGIVYEPVHDHNEAPVAQSNDESKLPPWIQDHLDRYRSTNGEDGYLWDASAGGGTGMVATLLLTTIGRKSGKQLTLPLIFGRSGDDYVVVASKGGARNHPAWYLNLDANPLVQVQVKADKFKAQAHTATGDERELLWQKMVDIYGPYSQYQKNTQREIPVVVLRRV
jgi:deazaflavin-dependent oxidoreductase (nitroreductase family)